MPPVDISADRPADDATACKFRLGLFGDTRSGKTMYLTALYWSAQEGRLAMVRAGQWPPGDLDTEPVRLLAEYRAVLSELRDVVDQSDSAAYARLREHVEGAVGDR